MRYLYSLVAVMAMVSLSFDMKGQNLVPNGGFEQYTTCPTGAAFSAGSWRSYTNASPDYFNACSPAVLIAAGVPRNFGGYQYALEGVGYEGLLALYSIGYREYIAANMTPMTPGTTYFVSMYVSLSNNYDSVGSDNLGVYFFDSGPAAIPTTKFLNVIPQVSFQSFGCMRDTVNWMQLWGLFTADSAYDNIVIGGFLPDSVVTLTSINSFHSYYYIDSVLVTGKPLANISAADSLYCVGDTIKVSFSAITPLLAASNVFYLQLSDASGSFSSATTIDTITGNNSGTFQWVVPSGVTTGTGFKLRMLSTDLQDTLVAGKTITISSIVPAKPVAGSNSPVCTADTIKFTALSSTSGVSYKWSGTGFSSGSQNPFIANALSGNAGQYIVTAWLGGCKSKDTVSVTMKISPSFALSYNASPCQTDTLKLTTTGSSTSINYRWKGPHGFTASQKDTVRALMGFADTGYYVNTGTLNGCTFTDSIRVSIRPFPQAFSATSNTPLCQGSVLNLGGNTSSTGVTFNWTGPGSYTAAIQSPSISNAHPTHSGSYILTATLNGCSLKDTEVVNVIGIPAVPTPTANTPVCVSQTLSLNVGSSGPGFVWSGPGFTGSGMTPSIPNATSAMAGVYTVKAVDGACESAPASVTVVVIPKPTVNTYPSPKDSICDGSTVTFNASSSNAGTAPGHRWFRNGIQEPGAFANKYSTIPPADYDVYYCMVTSNGTCATPFSDTSNHITMRVFPLLPASVSITATPNGPVVGGNLITFNATPVNGGGSPKYQWKRNNKDVVGALSNTWGANNLADKDVICVEMSSTYMCPQPNTATSNCITVSINTTGIDNAKLMTGISIYPNPIHDELIIEGISKGTAIQLFDVLGRVVINTLATKEIETINTSVLTNGDYLLQLTDVNSNRMNVKIMKQ